MVINYGWRKVHEAAMFGAGDGDLQDRIKTARAAIHQRFHELQHYGEEAINERLALSKALVGLYLLRSER